MSRHSCDRFEVGVPFDRARHCTPCYLFHNEPAYRDAILGKRPAVTNAARGPCLHLGKRAEFREGCGGYLCKHECDAGHEFAVPGGNCQTCPDYESEASQP